MSDLISIENTDGISVITLDDGKANVMSPAMLAALNSALDDAEAAGSIVVIRGRDGLFSGGFDLGVFKSGDQGQIFAMLEGGAVLSERLLSYPQPVIAACTGHAMAMGLFMLLSCDYRIGCNSGHRFAANEVAIGMTLPYFATEVCRQRMAPAAFNSGLTLARVFASEEAVAAGILDQVVTPQALDAAVMEKAESFKQLDMASHRATKQRLRADLLAKLRGAIEADCAGWSQRVEA